MGSVSGHNIYAKSVALTVSPSIVSVVVPFKKHQIPKEGHNGRTNFIVFDDGDIVAYGISGVIVECEELTDGSYMGYIITLATPFLRTDDVQLSDIGVEVYLCDGKLCQGEVLGSDLHYNLAVVRIISHTPLQVANLKSLDDIISINPADVSPPRKKNKTGWLRPHSSLFKILPGDRIVVVTRAFSAPHPMIVYHGVYSIERPQAVPNEGCCISGIERQSAMEGGAVTNYYGEVIGIILNESFFYPVNMVSRWWKHYRSCGEFYRPWIGCEVSNLHGESVNFLENFTRKFPNVATGVVVEKVARNSPAYCSGIRRGDVIVGVDGKLIHNTIELYEKLWEKARDSIKFDVLRSTDGNRFESNTMISEVTQDKFHRWKLANAFEKL